MDFSKLEKKKQSITKSLPKLDQWFDIELTYTSNAIEGNSLSRDETKAIIENNSHINGKSLTEHLEVHNHLQALHLIKMHFAVDCTR